MHDISRRGFLKVARGKDRRVDHAVATLDPSIAHVVSVPPNQVTHANWV